MRNLIDICCIVAILLYAITIFKYIYDGVEDTIHQSRSSSKYQARLINCDHGVVEPNEYIVYLKRGISLDEHKRNVGKAFHDSELRFIFDETYLNDVSYSAEIDQESLAIIRADDSVDFVECNGIVEADDLVMSDDLYSLYQAPLTHCDTEWVQPGSYVVHLKKGISLDEHKRNVGDAFPGPDNLRAVYDWAKTNDVSYSARIDEKVLAIIRGDRTVKHVSCVTMSSIPGGEIEDDQEHEV